MAITYVLDLNGSPLMPTIRSGKVYRILKSKKAKVVNRKPFTIQLLYETKTKVVQHIILGIDPGRTNIGDTAIRADGKTLYSAHTETRNKEIPKLMANRKAHRMASRKGERLCRKRRAKKCNTIFSYPKERILPKYEKPIFVYDIINSESKFCNRERDVGWLTPTARQLLQTHLNKVEKTSSLLPIQTIAIEINKFAFMALDNPNIKKWDYASGPLYKKGSLEEVVLMQQNCHCIFCKNEIDHYHHIVPKSKGGSNTISNIAGICEKHHTLIHNDEKWNQKLLTKKNGLNKKYGALSVLNQIIPFLINELSKKYEVIVTNGYNTKCFRDEFNIEKDHNIDAYCIAASILKDNDNFPLDIPKDCFELKQFRKHNRSIINSQTERTYKLDNQIVAKNRRKRMDQKEDSLHEWYIKTKQQFGKIETRKIQSKLQVTRSTRRYNTKNRLMPGTQFKYKNKIYTMNGQLSNGQYLRAVGDKNTNYPTKDCTIIRNNSGLVYI
jgi:5-methylcytosine-specific restriction endonuclease McrA